MSKTLKSIEFPGLPESYEIPQVDKTLMVSGKAADAMVTGAKIKENATAINRMLTAGTGEEFTRTNVANANAPRRNGWFGYTSETLNIPDGFTGGVIEVSAYSSTCVFQTFRDRTGYIAHRMYDGTNFSEFEYENPPMIPGVEYRTTERWGGAPVYTKVINWGYMPNKAYEGRECGVDATKIIEIRAYAHYVSNNSKQVFPLHSLAGGGITAVCWAEGIKIFIQTFYDESHGTAHVIIKYTKD